MTYKNPTFAILSQICTADLEIATTHVVLQKTIVHPGYNIYSYNTDFCGLGCRCVVRGGEDFARGS